MESTIQINSQLNGQIEFQFVRNTYPLDDKLYCYFSVPVNGTFKPEHGDFIGIYPVGWTGLGEVRCKKMISVEEFGYNQETGCGYVVFEPYQLPKNMEQFHQFVYIKNGEIVRGTSKPFQFEVNPFYGQPEKMIELGRQQKEIRKQIERIEKEGRHFTYKQEPTLQHMIAQLRQNEERISNIKQQFEELKGCQQTKKWTHNIQVPQGVQYTTQQWGVQTGMTEIPTGMTGMTRIPTGMTGIPTGMIPTEITVVPTGIPTGIQQQYTVVCGVQQPTEMTYGQRLVFPEGLNELQQTIQVLKYGLQELKQEMTKYPTVYQTKGYFFKQQIQQIEEQIAEFRRLMKIKMVQQVYERMGLVGQQWCTPLVQKLREFEFCLKSELNNIEISTGIEMMPIRGVHVERMLTKVVQLINFFECQNEITSFEETKCRFVLTQLRELESCLNEFYQKHSTYWTTVVIPQGGKVQQQKRQIRELINEVQQIVSMRIRHFVEVLQQFVDMEQQPRCEDKLWKEIRNLECQLYGIKQLDNEIEFGEYKQWLNEFERKIQQQQPLNIFNDECKIVSRQEQLYQQIRELKGFWQQYKKLFTRGFFHLQSEQMQQFRFLTKLIVLVEQQMVEFHTKLSELKMKIEQQQYQTILKKQLQLFQQIKNLKYYLPYEQQEMITFLVRQKVQQVVQECERYLPVDMELYQPIHRQIRKLFQHLKNLEIQQGEEQTQWEIKQVLKHHFTGLRQLHQQIREFERIFTESLIEGSVKVGQYVPTYPQQFHYNVKQQIRELYQFVQNHIEFFGVEQPEGEFNGQQTFGYLVGLTCDLTLPKFEELNNNVLITFEPSNIKEWTWNTLVELLNKFHKLGMIEQETIVSELVHRYIQCLKKSTGCDEEIRRKFEQLYVENTKLGQMLRNRVNEVAELKKQFQELQIAKSLLEMRLNQQTVRKYENIERPLTTFEKRQFTVEQQPEFYEPKISITVERVTPVQPEDEDEEEQYYKPIIKQNVSQIVSELEYQLNKMRMQPEEFPRQPTTQGWFVRSQSGQEFPTKVNFYPEECLRSVEGTLLVKQQPKPYQIRDDIYINQLQKKLNKLAGQQPTGIEQETTLFSL